MALVAERLLDAVVNREWLNSSARLCMPFAIRIIWGIIFVFIEYDESNCAWNVGQLKDPYNSL